MATIKAYTDISQSKKLAEILPLESADMVLPFTYKENNEYVAEELTGEACISDNMIDDFRKAMESEK